MKEIKNNFIAYINKLWYKLNVQEQSFLYAISFHFIIFLIILILPYTFLNPMWRSLNMGKSQTIYVDLNNIKINTKTVLDEKDARIKSAKKSTLVEKSPAKKKVKANKKSSHTPKDTTLESDKKGKDGILKEEQTDTVVVKKPKKVRVIEETRDLNKTETNKPYDDNFIKRENVENDYQRPMKELSVSVRDAIRVRLRQCWNVDAGAKGIQNMKIEISTTFTPDGAVKSVDIIDKVRYEQDTSFRSVADSARRAVWICSPFSFLPKELYSEWKEINFNFYPYKGKIE